jgi:hypothetical protein
VRQQRRITYNGPHDEITIPALPGVVVRRGVPISTTAELTESLLSQATWSEFTEPSTKPTSKADAVEEVTG